MDEQKQYIEEEEDQHQNCMSNRSEAWDSMREDMSNHPGYVRLENILADILVMYLTERQTPAPS